MTETIDADSPELRVLARAAGVAPARMAAAFNEPAPAKFFDHITLDELSRLKESCDRLAVLMAALADRTHVILAALKGAN